MSRSFAMLLSDTSRSRAYLDSIHRAGLEPELVIFINCRGTVSAAAERFESSFFENRYPVDEMCRRLGFKVRTLEVDSINDAAVLSHVEALEADHLVYSGPPGALLGKALLATGKCFIHVHPGKLPAYRGSTTMYYSLLAENSLSATAMYLSPEIDCGELVAERSFRPPEDGSAMDNEFDPWMRASLLVEVLQRLVTEGHLAGRPQPQTNELPYYVIHPVLKHLTILQTGSGEQAP
ncbi:MAG: hypothetical protein HKN15_01475 [Xanthomonadales bacterium]|nr:hypothetical protein [Xanthomonadales bacterium]